MPHTRNVDLAVISDVHLGSYGCHAEELTRYLESIKPGVLVINGDLLDIWQFKKYYWPESHMQVLQTILDLLKMALPLIISQATMMKCLEATLHLP